MPRKGRRFLVLAAVAVVAVAVTLEVAATADLGRWAPVALDGAALDAVVATEDALVVGGPTGAHRLADGGVVELDVDAAVSDLLVHEGRVLAATGAGVLSLNERGAEPIVLDGQPVDQLLAHDGGAFAVADGGVVDVADGRALVRSGSGVRAAASVAGTVLLGMDEGVGRPDGAGDAELLWRGPSVDLVAGVPDGDGTRFLAAVRGDEPLLAASAPEGPWEPATDGLRLATVEALARDPARDGGLFAGGTGLDDGESGERGGVAESADSGRAWTNERDRLAAVHVYAFAVRDEPLRVEVGVAGRELGTIAVPLTRPHVYAGTNGAGLYRRQPPLPGAQTAAALAPVGRMLAPAALGALLLWGGWHGFTRLAGRTRPSRTQLPPVSASQGGERRPTPPAATSPPADDAGRATNDTESEARKVTS